MYLSRTTKRRSMYTKFKIFDMSVVVTKKLTNVNLRKIFKKYTDLWLQ